MKAKVIKLHDDERIIAVVPEHYYGPGWQNSPAWVYIATGSGKLRGECIQPDGRSPELNMLFNIGEVVCAALISAIPTEKVSHEKNSNRVG